MDLSNAKYAKGLAFLTIIGLTGESVAANMASRTDIASRSEVQKAALTWFNSLQGKTYKTTIRANNGIKRLPLEDISQRNSLFEISEGQFCIGLGFKAPPKSTSTLADLRKSLSYISFDTFPIPGVNAKSWQTRLLTPAPSFTNGVTLEAWSKGMLRLKVKTKFFAMQGYRIDNQLPFDKGNPDTFFQIQKPISADVTIVGSLVLPPK